MSSEMSKNLSRARFDTAAHLVQAMHLAFDVSHASKSCTCASRNKKKRKRTSRLLPVT